MAGLLEGVRVLDLSVWRPGPYASQLLVEMGAAVVKVEPPGGDPMRVFPTLFAGYGVYRVSDGWITLGVLSEDHLWSALCAALGLDDGADLDFAARTERVDDLEARLRAALAGQARDELVGALLAAGVPVAPVLTQVEMLSAEPLRARGTVAPGPDGAPTIPHPLRYRVHPAADPTDVPALTESAGDLPDWP